MPIFGNTFSPKKIPPRKSASLSSLHTLDRSTREIELGLEYGPPAMNIGGLSWKFEEGQCSRNSFLFVETESGGNTSGRELRRLKKRNAQLEEENNLLKLKIELLMDMLTETTVEYHMMEKEVDELKSQH
ncbi:hypothetical protein JOB18_010958 [Solea senegalensis]|uniref:Uncharacterized protein n=1 Tax=Solea senegalensis TaxID=28829 RepID=A0AAV6RMV9_SOLSE|nr:hypothetical protein JOB18_010958 [Solea senegalensis]